VKSILIDKHGGCFGSVAKESILHTAAIRGSEVSAGFSGKVLDSIHPQASRAQHEASEMVIPSALNRNVRFSDLPDITLRVQTDVIYCC
jgi:hypothetical protein